jgi:hypothetical protein
MRAAGPRRPVSPLASRRTRDPSASAAARASSTTATIASKGPEHAERCLPAPRRPLDSVVS